MAPQADFAKIGYEIEKFFGGLKSFSNGNNPPATQNLCRYKFYPSYAATKVVQMHVEDVKCNEAASRFTPQNITGLQIKGLVGQ
ncbi:hypothetical protein LR48_Vigan635s012200 [Vigna angularis]|uniref:Uncharacterized protein n=2 Tax=Phaseolus angularis TaxID=3914 RepID=A0A0L9TFI6_PHAAN|nr:hypothetical protein LR48_Vigan635s012200 [Vigna angularis]BAT80299.1 hypothetical protein VIGAN_02329700 [Vigna angularis var. angularis]